MAQVLAKDNKYMSDFQAFERELGAGEPMWFRQIRQLGLARFSELGFPRPVEATRSGSTPASSQ